MTIGPALTGEISGAIDLPLSKSESNRVLVIKALCGTLTEDTEAAECDDSRLLKSALLMNRGKSTADKGVETMETGHGAAPARFLTAVMACVEGRKVILTGSERLKQRPIAPLVDALTTLGGEIRYNGAQGCLPLQITGHRLRGGIVETEAGVSSQFISALMLIGPTLEGGLEIVLKGEPVSAPYIGMTATIMRRFGGKVRTGDGRITVEEGGYKDCDYTPEADWSAATFWYALMAVAGRGEMTLKGLTRESCQPDSRAAEIFAHMGVRTEYTAEGVKIMPSGECVEELEMDCTDVPDMALPLITACCAKGIRFRLSGLRTLAMKESDRRHSISEELRKFGFAPTEEGADMLMWDGRRVATEEGMPRVKTWDDHRVAMAMASIGWGRRFTMENADVVTKSYPAFWEHMSRYEHIARE